MKKLLALLLIAGSAFNAFAGCSSCRKPAVQAACPSCNTYNEEKSPKCRYWKSVQATAPACKHVQVSYSCPTKTADGYQLVEDHDGSLNSNVPPTLQHLNPSK